MPTLSMQDYAKALYVLEQRQPGRISTSALASYLDLSPAAVTEMLHRMAKVQPPLVDYRPRRGARLTTEGQRLALRMLRRHRLLERFLHDVLGFPLEQVHTEAERLEHAVSDAFIQRLAAWMGEPKSDPHGHPIPGPDLQPPDAPGRPFRSLAPDARAQVVQVCDRDPEQLRRLAALGLRPGQRFRVLERDPYEPVFRIRLEPQGTEVLVGPRLAAALRVEPLATEASSS
ncbi:MAG: metal-dependent transcriptional regulator [Chloroflexi bacterium]|nr:metal-dependent transcriptional regulator [Chloroflexota bacterium]